MAEAQINPTQAYYIKLGSGGMWERQCLESGTIRLGFSEMAHELCIHGEWETLKQDHSTRTVNQVRKFYEADATVMWITFYADCLWWCFAEPQVFMLEDGSRVRYVVDRWRNVDANGDELRTSRLKGSLAAVQGYRSTICNVREFDYLVNRINGYLPPEVRAVQQTLEALYLQVEEIIQHLHPNEFEVLIDLIFRQAGWQRLSKLGGVQAGIDLELYSPIAHEIYKVQVKSRADLATFDQYRAEFDEAGGFARFYFVVHTPGANLTKEHETEDFKLILPHDIAQWTVRYGLTDWLLQKAE